MTVWTASSLLTRIAELEAALGPFARIAPVYQGRAAETRLLSTAHGDVLVSHLRGAHMALHSTSVS